MVEEKLLTTKELSELLGIAKYTLIKMEKFPNQKGLYFVKPTRFILRVGESKLISGLYFILFIMI